MMKKQIAITIILLLGIAVSVFLSQRQQIFKSRASLQAYNAFNVASAEPGKYVSCTGNVCETNTLNITISVADLQALTIQEQQKVADEKPVVDDQSQDQALSSYFQSAAEVADREDQEFARERGLPDAQTLGTTQNLISTLEKGLDVPDELWQDWGSNLGDLSRGAVDLVTSQVQQAEERGEQKRAQEAVQEVEDLRAKDEEEFAQSITQWRNATPEEKAQQIKIALNLPSDTSDEDALDVFNQAAEPLGINVKDQGNGNFVFELIPPSFSTPTPGISASQPLVSTTPLDTTPYCNALEGEELSQCRKQWGDAAKMGAIIGAGTVAVVTAPVWVPAAGSVIAAAPAVVSAGSLQLYVYATGTGSVLLANSPRIAQQGLGVLAKNGDTVINASTLALCQASGNPSACIYENYAQFPGAPVLKESASVTRAAASKAREGALDVAVSKAFDMAGAAKSRGGELLDSIWVGTKRLVADETGAARIETLLGPFGRVIPEGGLPLQSGGPGTLQITKASKEILDFTNAPIHASPNGLQQISTKGIVAIERHHKTGEILAERDIVFVRNDATGTVEAFYKSTSEGLWYPFYGVTEKGNPNLGLPDGWFAKPKSDKFQHHAPIDLQERIERALGQDRAVNFIRLESPEIISNRALREANLVHKSALDALQAVDQAERRTLADAKIVKFDPADLPNFRTQAPEYSYRNYHDKEWVSIYHTPECICRVVIPDDPASYGGKDILFSVEPNIPGGIYKEVPTPLRAHGGVVIKESEQGMYNRIIEYIKSSPFVKDTIEFNRAMLSASETQKVRAVMEQVEKRTGKSVVQQMWEIPSNRIAIGSAAVTAATLTGGLVATKYYNEEQKRQQIEQMEQREKERQSKELQEKTEEQREKEELYRRTPEYEYWQRQRQEEQKKQNLLPAIFGIGQVLAQEDDKQAFTLSGQGFEMLIRQELAKMVLEETGKLTSKDIEEILKLPVLLPPFGNVFITNKTGVVEGDIKAGQYLIETDHLSGLDIKIPLLIEAKQGTILVPVAIRKGSGKVEKVAGLSRGIGGGETAKVRVAAFYDENGNGRWDAGEKALPWAGIQVTLSKIIQEKIIHLKEGWNLITLPALPVTPLTARGLLVQIAKQEGSASAVSTLENGAWKSYVMQDNQSYSRDNFTLEPGKAYFVNAARRSTFSFTGQEFASPVKLFLKTGWNAVGFPKLSKQFKSRDLGASGEFTIEENKSYLLKLEKEIDFSP